MFTLLLALLAFNSLTNLGILYSLFKKSSAPVSLPAPPAPGHNECHKCRKVVARHFIKKGQLHCANCDPEGYHASCR